MKEIWNSGSQLCQGNKLLQVNTESIIYSNSANITA